MWKFEDMYWFHVAECRV